MSSGRGDAAGDFSQFSYKPGVKVEGRTSKNKNRQKSRRQVMSDSDDSDNGKGTTASGGNEKSVTDKEADEILTSPEVSRRRRRGVEHAAGVSNGSSNGAASGGGGASGDGDGGDTGGGGGDGVPAQSDGGTSSGSEDVPWYKKPLSGVPTVKVEPATAMASPGEWRTLRSLC